MICIKNIKGKRCLSGFLILSMYLISSFLPILNVSGVTFLNTELAEDRIATVDYTEEDLEGSMHWSKFLTDCSDTNTQYNLFGYFDAITFHMEMNFDKGTISGSCSGSHTYDVYTWKRGLSFSGEFTGILEKYNWNYNSWFWEFDSNFSLSLTFRYEQRCTNEQNEVYWNTRQEAITVNARLGGSTFAGRGGIGAFSIRWEDPGSGPEELRRFSLTCKNRLDSGGCDLPADIPEAIDISATVQGPYTVRNTDAEVIFVLEASGRDLDRVKEVNWYFSYFTDNGWEHFWWFETFTRTDTSPLVISGEKLTEWEWYVNTYGNPINGEKGLLLQIIVEFKASEYEWLLEVEGYNFTYIVGHSIDFNLIMDDVIEVYPTMKNESIFIFEHTPDALDDNIFYEVTTTLPNYLSVEFERSKDTNSSDDGLLENKLIVSLDMTKAPSISLPSEHKITCKARSVFRKESIETSKEITLQLNPVEWLNLHYIASQSSGLGTSLQVADMARIDKIVETFNASKEGRIGYILLIDLERSWSPKYYDGTLNRGGNLLMLYHGKLKKIESKMINMGSSDSLQHFIETAQTLIPSKKHHLIIADHGLGINGVAMDGNPTDFLDAPELRTALGDKHFDLITFETCQTALIEIFYELRKAADYIIASQHNMYGDGINHVKIFSALHKKPKSSAIELAQSIIDTYAETIPRPLTLSLVKTSELEELATKIDVLANAIQEEYGKNSDNLHNEIMKAYKETTVTGESGEIDLFDFCLNLLKYNVPSSVKVSAQSILDYKDSVIVKNVVDHMDQKKILISRGLIPLEEPPEGPEESQKPDTSMQELLKTPSYNGMSIFFWNSGVRSKAYSDLKAKFDATQFAQNTAWKGFVEEYTKLKSKQKVIITTEQHEKNLYPRVVDSDGYSVGYDSESLSRRKVEVQIQDAIYYRSPEGITEIILPAGFSNFTTFIYGGLMEEEEESYTLTIEIVDNDEVLLMKIIENSIALYNDHSLPVTITEDAITLGELTVTDNTPEPEQKPQPEEETDKPGGIPGFSTESVLLGLVICVTIIWLTSRVRVVTY